MLLISIKVNTHFNSTKCLNNPSETYQNVFRLLKSKFPYSYYLRVSEEYLNSLCSFISL